MGQLTSETPGYPEASLSRCTKPLSSQSLEEARETASKMQ